MRVVEIMGVNHGRVQPGRRGRGQAVSVYQHRRLRGAAPLGMARDNLRIQRSRRPGEGACQSVGQLHLNGFYRGWRQVLVPQLRNERDQVFYGVHAIAPPRNIPCDCFLNEESCSCFIAVLQRALLL